MIKEERINMSIEKYIRELYTVNSNLKEVYNECQYYMSHNELKEFYEKSFFSKNNFSNDLYAHIKAKNQAILFMANLKTSYFISYLTFQLFFKKNEIEFLFEKALKLEEKNFRILAKLLQLNVSAKLKPILKAHYDDQGIRVASIKKALYNQH